jgi:hypothetical protein
MDEGRSQVQGQGKVSKTLSQKESIKQKGWGHHLSGRVFT